MGTSGIKSHIKYIYSREPCAHSKEEHCMCDYAQGCKNSAIDLFELSKKNCVVAHAMANFYKTGKDIDKFNLPKDKSDSLWQDLYFILDDHLQYVLKTQAKIDQYAKAARKTIDKEGHSGYSWSVSINMAKWALKEYGMFNEYGFVNQKKTEHSKSRSEFCYKCSDYKK